MMTLETAESILKGRNDNIKLNSKGYLFVFNGGRGVYGPCFDQTSRDVLETVFVNDKEFLDRDCFIELMDRFENCFVFDKNMELVGFVWFTNFNYNSCEVHFAVQSGKVFSAVNTCYEILSIFSEKYNTSNFIGIIPAENKLARKFMIMAGMYRQNLLLDYYGPGKNARLGTLNIRGI